MRKIITCFFCLFALNLVFAQTIDSLNYGPQDEELGDALDRIAVIVGDDIITERELVAKDDISRQAKMQQLIMEKLLLQKAKESNITIGDTAINLELESRAKQSNLSIDSFRKKIERSGLRYEDYRYSIEKELMIARLQQSVVNSLVKISDQEVDDAMKKEFTNITDEVNISDLLVLIPEADDSDLFAEAQNRVEQILDEIKTASPEAIASRYDNVRYIELGWVELNKIPARFIQGLINVGKGEYSKPIVDKDGIHILRVIDRRSDSLEKVVRTETKASHILIEINNAQDSDVARAEIDKILNQLKKGANFSELAETYSDDIGSATRGGDLGWILPGQMVPEFEQVLNNTDKGQISSIFKSRFGWHILKVFDRREIESTTEDVLKQQIRQAIFQKKAAEEWNLWLTQLRDEAYIEIR